MTIIKLAQIKRRGRGWVEYNRFAKDFPDGLKVTKSELLRVAELKYDIGWLAWALLPSPIEAEYLRQRVPLHTEYLREIEPIDADYRRQRDPIDADYRRQQALVLLRCLLKREGK